MHRIPVALIVAAAALGCALPADARTPPTAPAPLVALAAEPDAVPADSARPLLVTGHRILLTASVDGDTRLAGPLYGLPRTGGRAVALAGGSVDSLAGVLSDGRVLANDSFDGPLVGGARGPMRPLPVPPGLPADGVTVAGDGATTVFSGGRGQVVVRRAGVPDRSFPDEGFSVLGVTGTMILTARDPGGQIAPEGEDVVYRVRSALTWEVVTTITGVQTRAHALTPDGALTYAQDDGTVLRTAPGAAAPQVLGRIRGLPARSAWTLVLAGDRVVVGAISGGGGVGVVEADGTSHLSGPRVPIEGMATDGDDVIWRGNGCVVRLDPASGPTPALPAGDRTCPQTRIALTAPRLRGRSLSIEVECLGGPSGACTFTLEAPGAAPSRRQTVATAESTTVTARLPRAPSRDVGVKVLARTTTEPDQPVALTVYPDPPRRIPGGTRCSTLAFGAGNEDYALVAQRGTSCGVAETVAKWLYASRPRRVGRVRVAGFSCVRYRGSESNGGESGAANTTGTWRCTRGRAHTLITLR